MSEITLLTSVTEKLFKQLEARIEALENTMKRNFHGNSGYTKGCRCEICRAARKIQMRRLRSK